MAQEQAHAAPSLEETAITLFCWWESIAASPHIVKTLFGGVISDSLKLWLLSVNSRPDFWVMLPLFVISLPLIINFLLRHKRPIPPSIELPKVIKNSIDSVSFQTRDARTTKIVERLEKRNRRVYVLRLLRSVGLVWVREKLLDKMGVALYGTFERPSEWVDPGNRSIKVDRINYTDHTGVEYQYSKDYTVLFVRTHPAEAPNYGTQSIREPTRSDCRLLLMASTYFIWWYFCYLLKKIWH